MKPYYFNLDGKNGFALAAEVVSQFCTVTYLDTAICILTEVLQSFIVLYYYKNYMGSNIALMHFFLWKTSRLKHKSQHFVTCIQNQCFVLIKRPAHIRVSLSRYIERNVIQFIHSAFNRTSEVFWSKAKANVAVSELLPKGCPSLSIKEASQLKISQFDLARFFLLLR